jgi:hypothetical protein
MRVIDSSLRRRRPGTVDPWARMRSLRVGCRVGAQARRRGRGDRADRSCGRFESVRIGQWDKGWFAYVLPVHCDGPSLYFRLIQPLSERDTDAPGRNPSSTPRRVTKLSADGKNRVELDPARSPKLAAANSLLTAGRSGGMNTGACSSWCGPRGMGRPRSRTPTTSSSCPFEPQGRVPVGRGNRTTRSSPPTSSRYSS